MADRRQGLPSDPPTATGTDAFVAPSGEQVEITHGDQRATVVELGGGLRTYTSRGRDLLDGYGIEEMCSGGRGQVLMPWPNRIRDGSYEIDGHRLQLALTEPKAGNAIHGLVRWASWTIKHRTPGSVLMEHRLYPQPGYPFVLELSIEYALRDDGLSVRSTATNIGTTRCPFGSGAHPYLTLGKQLDELSIEAPGQTILNADSRGIPLDSSSVRAPLSICVSDGPSATCSSIMRSPTSSGTSGVWRGSDSRLPTASAA